jgi:hypothetical protein
MPTLEDKIAAAFTQSTPSNLIGRLIGQAQDAAAAADKQATKSQDDALNPALSGNDLERARREMDDAAFRRDRLTAAASRLEGRLKEMLRAEEDARRQIEYDRAKAERDALAEEIKEVYPALARQLAELANRMAANDRALELINRARRPTGAPALKLAEALARELAHVAAAGSDAPRIAKMLRLPAFVQKPNRPYEWPPIT